MRQGKKVLWRLISLFLDYGNVFKSSFVFIGILGLIFSCSSSEKKRNELQSKKPKVLENLIDSVGKKDTLFIKSVSVGCFHFYLEELKIFKKSDSLYGELTLSLPHREKIYKPLTQFFNDSAIIAYREFEKSGKSYKTENNCTTKESYVISLKEDSLKFTDNGCKLHGYDLLKSKLFGDSELSKLYEQTYTP